MSGVLFTGDNYQSLKNDGTINASGTLTFYSPGTTTLKTVYADQALVTPITNPVTLDSHGRATVFLDGTNYDLYVKDSTGTLLYSVLNIYTPPTATATMAEWTGNTQDSATSYSGTQVSSTSFTISTDVTSYFHVGRRIKVVQGGTIVYGYIVSSSYGAPNTTVTTINDSGSFPAGALTVYLSLLRADNHALPATAAYVLESNDAGATVGPAFTLDRNSASPAISDVLGGLLLNGRNSGAASKTYAQIQGEIVDPTAASEDGQVSILTMIAGTLTKVGKWVQGLQIGSPTGGDKGAGTINATALYENGAQLGLGANQTWQDLTGSRALTTVYQNTTGKPIAVNVASAYQTSASLDVGFSLYVGTANPPTIRLANARLSLNGSGSLWVGAIIPNNSYYKVTSDGVQALAVNVWAEMR